MRGGRLGTKQKPLTVAGGVRSNNGPTELACKGDELRWVDLKPVKNKKQ